MLEKRTTNRNRVFKAGTIEFGGGAIDCTIRNVSNDGAALDVRKIHAGLAERRSNISVSRRLAQGTPDRRGV
jgi:hypothetical protein